MDNNFVDDNFMNFMFNNEASTHNDLKNTFFNFIFQNYSLELFTVQYGLCVTRTINLMIFFIHLNLNSQLHSCLIWVHYYTRYIVTIFTRTGSP